MCLCIIRKQEWLHYVHGPRYNAQGRNWCEIMLHLTFFPVFLLISSSYQKKKFFLIQKARAIFLPFPMDVGCLSGRGSCSIANEFVSERSRAREGKEPLPWVQQLVPGETFWHQLYLPTKQCCCWHFFTQTKLNALSSGQNKHNWPPSTECNSLWLHRSSSFQESCGCEEHCFVVGSSALL